MKLLANIVTQVTSRKLENIEVGDIRYLVDKVLLASFRGFFWSLCHIRKPNGLMLGASIQFVSAGNLSLGRGVFIGRNSYCEFSSLKQCSLMDGVTIRENAWIQCRSGINQKGEGLVVGKGTYIGPFSVLGIGGEVLIGNGCQIGARFTVSAESHVASNGSYVSGGTTRLGVKIGDKVWIGNGVIVLDGVEIGEGSVIGAGSVVTKSIPSGVIAFGSPAKVVRNIN